MVSLLNAWGSDFFDVAINTGDTVYTLFSQGLDWYDGIVEASSIPILNTVGNHDAWTSLNPIVKANQVDVYNMITAKVAEETSIIQPSNASANGLNYYYKDVGDIRVIILDCMYWDNTQLSWFESVLESARTNNLPVIACDHAPFAQAECDLIESSWNGKPYADDGVVMNIAAASAVQTFVQNGGVFVCWLQGHRHMDEIALLKNYNNQLSFRTNTFQDRGTATVKNADESAYNYDCLTYVTVDSYNHFVKFYRIGANINTQGQKFNAFVWDYINNQAVTEW